MLRQPYSQQFLTTSVSTLLLLYPSLSFNDSWSHLYIYHSHPMQSLFLINLINQAIFTVTFPVPAIFHHHLLPFSLLFLFLSARRSGLTPLRSFSSFIMNCHSHPARPYFRKICLAVLPPSLPPSPPPLILLKLSTFAISVIQLGFLKRAWISVTVNTLNLLLPQSIPTTFTLHRGPFAALKIWLLQIARLFKELLLPLKLIALGSKKISLSFPPPLPFHISSSPSTVAD